MIAASVGGMRLRARRPRDLLPNRAGWTTLALGACLLSCGGETQTTGTTEPETTNRFMERMAFSRIDRIDLLFVISNSESMADKQEILRNAVPQLLNRLIDPVCVVPNTDPPEVTQDSSAMPCPDGTEPEFEAIHDIHVGVITASLGSNGGTLCSPELGDPYWDETQNDRGRLIVRQGPTFDIPATTWNDAGFLSWDPYGSAHNAADVRGEPDGTALVSTFQNLVTGAGESGCQFQAPLEAWYRFLIDPDPPLDIVFDPAQGESVAVGLDDVLLEQRAQFLRPDSLLAIVMLSDENDCSLSDHGAAYLLGDPTPGAMPRATSQCETDPSHPCCLSCIQANWPEQCDDPRTDPNCQAGYFHEEVDPADDPLSLRRYAQKQRFGLDFLHPTSRYVEGLTEREIVTRSGEIVTNPLFAPNERYYPDLAPRMDSSLIFLAGIVGVPWQDIATDDSLDTNTGTLRYLRADEIAARGIWSEILGDPAASPPVPPTDPFMLESVAPREGVNPRTGIAIAPPRAGPGGNTINGHESRGEGRDTLQYACIFPLGTTRECANAQPGQSCDCKTSDVPDDRALCDGTIQHYGKAYPATRQLQVLRDYGGNSIVASMCPKNPNCANPADINCGYNPAVNAIIDRLKDGVHTRCLSRAITTDEDGLPTCRFFEVTPEPYAVPCSEDLPGRRPPDDEARSLVGNEMRELGYCGGEAVDCDVFSICEITPAGPSVDSPTYQECLDVEEANIQAAAGFCYLDATTDRTGDGVVSCTEECYAAGAADCDCLGNPGLLRDCPADQRRNFRIVSPPQAEVPVPWPNSTVFFSCVGSG